MTERHQTKIQDPCIHCLQFWYSLRKKFSIIHSWWPTTCARPLKYFINGTFKYLPLVRSHKSILRASFENWPPLPNKQILMEILHQSFSHSLNSFMKKNHQEPGTVYRVILKSLFRQLILKYASTPLSSCDHFKKTEPHYHKPLHWKEPNVCAMTEQIFIH